MGVFFCPQCEADRTYELVAPRRWFTVFWIPVIPLNSLEQHVRCTTCKGAFREQVLATPTSEHFAHQLALATRAAVAHLVSVAGPTPAAADPAVRLVEPAAGARGYSLAQLDGDVAAFADRAPALRYVTAVAPYLSLAGKEDFVRRLLNLVSVHGLASEQLLSYPLEAIARTLDSSAAHLAGILTQSSPQDGVA